MKKKLKKVSVLITNYNNQKYINQCIKSLLNQKYKNLEILFHDDSSTDNSLKIVKKYKKVKVIKNKVRSNFGSYNQINALKKLFKKSSGEILFLLDSDDYFSTKKINRIMKVFNSNKSLIAIYDLPILKFPNKSLFVKNKGKILNNFWPYIPPQSCISIKRKNFKSIIDSINIRKFPDIWMDFRIAIYLKYIIKNFYVHSENLTFYRQSPNMISSRFKHLSFFWWKRRLQAHNYIKYYFNKNQITYKKNLDYYITIITNKFL